MPWREEPRSAQLPLSKESLSSLYAQLRYGNANLLISGYGSDRHPDRVELAVVLVDLTRSEKELFDALDAISEYVLTARLSLFAFYENAEIDRSPDM